jgi:hypothetical protein
MYDVCNDAVILIKTGVVLFASCTYEMQTNGKTCGHIEDTSMQKLKAQMDVKHNALHKKLKSLGKETPSRQTDTEITVCQKNRQRNKCCVCQRTKPHKQRPTLQKEDVDPNLGP